MKKFATFWKIIGDHYMKDSENINPRGVFIMLDLLEDVNPLIRHSAKSWLIDSKPLFFRILDPLFDALLDFNTKCFITPKKQFFYTQIYDTNKINDAFRRLKSILVTISDDLITYLINNTISAKLQDNLIHFQTTLIQNTVVTQQTYMMLLVTICIKYVQGQANEALDKKFQQDNASVNASSCEFLELLINRIEQKSVQLQIILDIKQQLQIALKHAIYNKDFVLEVQLLNLMKCIMTQMKQLAEIQTDFSQQ
eukprot:TRINITY_DN28949_c0_g1_i1.p2 TRINITY_DN28949_c0_g1~~TRINITY_DN28949_c0_g1_i1.p2  ORF type:complete len:253 (+),score=37.83 TRINITY_DN28949_c0_g1_i1:145-903(+)